MIIYGTLPLSSTLGTGVFFCPACTSEQPYRHRSSRTWFTLYFIPVFPISPTTQFVECGRCRGAYQEAVLQLDPSAAQAAAQLAFADEIRRVMVLTMLAGGGADATSSGVIRRVYGELCGLEVADQELAEDVRLAQAANAEAIGYVRRIAPQLTDVGKEWVVRAVFLIASARGEMQPAQQAVLSQLPSALGISQEQLMEMVSRVVEQGSRSAG